MIVNADCEIKGGEKSPLTFEAWFMDSLPLADRIESEIARYRGLAACGLEWAGLIADRLSLLADEIRFTGAADVAEFKSRSEILEG